MSSRPIETPVIDVKVLKSEVAKGDSHEALNAAVLLGNFYREKGDNSQAIAYFCKALSLQHGGWSSSGYDASSISEFLLTASPRNSDEPLNKTELNYVLGGMGFGHTFYDKIIDSDFFGKLAEKSLGILSREDFGELKEDFGRKGYGDPAARLSYKKLEELCTKRQRIDQAEFKQKEQFFKKLFFDETIPHHFHLEKIKGTPDFFCVFSQEDRKKHEARIIKLTSSNLVREFKSDEDDKTCFVLKEDKIAEMRDFILGEIPAVEPGYEPPKFISSAKTDAAASGTGKGVVGAKADPIARFYAQHGKK